jgi:hypothetical protein
VWLVVTCNNQNTPNSLNWSTSKNKDLYVYMGKKKKKKKTQSSSQDIWSQSQAERVTGARLAGWVTCQTSSVCDCVSPTTRPLPPGRLLLVPPPWTGAAMDRDRHGPWCMLPCRVACQWNGPTSFFLATMDQRVYRDSGEIPEINKRSEHSDKVDWACWTRAPPPAPHQGGPFTFHFVVPLLSSQLLLPFPLPCLPLSFRPSAWPSAPHHAIEQNVLLVLGCSRARSIPFPCTARPFHKQKPTPRRLPLFSPLLVPRYPPRHRVLASRGSVPPFFLVAP